MPATKAEQAGLEPASPSILLYTFVSFHELRYLQYKDFTASGRDLYRNEARFGLNELFILAQTSAYDLYSRKQECLLYYPARTARSIQPGLIVNSLVWVGFLDYLQRFRTISSSDIPYFVPPTRA